MGRTQCRILATLAVSISVASVSFPGSSAADDNLACNRDAAQPGCATMEGAGARPASGGQHIVANAKATEVCGRDSTRPGCSATTAVSPMPGVNAGSSFAPGFSALPKDAKLVIMPPLVQLFEISRGMPLKEDWTEAATRNFKIALMQKVRSLGANSVALPDAQSNEVAELTALHSAIARAIALHHFGLFRAVPEARALLGSFAYSSPLSHLDGLALPTKEGRLDWSFGESVQSIRKITGADYAVFTWVRDHYVGPGLLMLMILMPYASGYGVQVCYASLVDLDTGQVLWFNHLVGMGNDLRESAAAPKTLDALLQGFPVTQ